MDAAIDKIWNQKHCASDFEVGFEADEYRQALQVNKLSDMFQYQ